MVLLFMFGCGIFENNHQEDETLINFSHNYTFLNLDETDNTLDSASNPTAEDTAIEDPTVDDHSAACYLGSEGDYQACFDTVPHDPSWEGYEYPEPFQDSPQYAAPARFIDLVNYEPSLAVAPNFTLGEFLQVEKGQYGVLLPHLVDKIQQIRTETGYPLHITSAYRNVYHNELVGGSTFSRHQYGDAIDMYSSGVDLQELSDACRELGASFVSLYETHIHCDWRNTALQEPFYAVADEHVEQHESAFHPFVEKIGDQWFAFSEEFDEGEPLRIWHSYDVAADLIEIVEAAQYKPPVNAKWVRVEIGGLTEVQFQVQ